jgi:hypothetical protein
MLFKTETLKYQYGNHKNSNAAKWLLNKKGNFWHRTEMSNYRKLFKNIFVGLVGCPAVAQATPCKYSSVPNEVQRGEASDADHTQCHAISCLGGRSEAV